jgi:hypothetical protein
MDYSKHMLAKAEHDLMIRSLSPVSEFGETVVFTPPNRWWRKTQRLFSALRNGLAHLRGSRRAGNVPARKPLRH